MKLSQTWRKCHSINLCTAESQKKHLNMRKINTHQIFKSSQKSTSAPTSIASKSFLNTVHILRKPFLEHHLTLQWILSTLTELKKISIEWAQEVAPNTPNASISRSNLRKCLIIGEISFNNKNLWANKQSSISEMQDRRDSSRDKSV